MDVLLVGATESEDLATRYLAAVARGRGHTVRLAALGSPTQMDRVVLVAQSEQPRLIGLSIPFQTRAAEFMILATRLRSVLPRMHLTAGGPVPTFAAQELLQDAPALDSVVRGEGEFTLAELIDHVNTPAAWDDIAGLAFRRNGQIFVNGPRSPVSNLDTLPFPARDTAPRQLLAVGISPLLSGRGCYRQCSYCSIPALYGSNEKRQRMRTISDVAEEMELMYRSSGVRWFTFVDDEWFPKGQARYTRVGNLEQECKARGLDVMLSIQCRADDVTEPLFRRLREMGLVRARVGVASGSDQSLRRLNRRTTVAQNRHALSVMFKFGLLADWDLMVFEPDCSVEDMRANLDFAREMIPITMTPIHFGRAQAYPGSPLFDRLQSEGRSRGTIVAPDYWIADSRLELVSRCMNAALENRMYRSEGVVPLCSDAWDELIVTKYLLKEAMPPEPGRHLRSIVARLNLDTLGLVEEMFQFSLQGDIYDTGRVNDLAAEWALRAQVLDAQLESELAGWHAQLTLTRNSCAPARQMPLF